MFDVFPGRSILRGIPVNGKEFPSFKDREDWYDYVVFAGTSRGKTVGRKCMTKVQLHNVFNKELNALNIHSYKVTHLGRLFSMLFCHEEEVPEAEIMRNIEKYRDHAIFGLPLFRDKRYLAFENRVQKLQRSVNITVDKVLSAAYPAMVGKIDSLSTSMSGGQLSIRNDIQDMRELAIKTNTLIMKMNGAQSHNSQVLNNLVLSNERINTVISNVGSVLSSIDTSC